MTTPVERSDASEGTRGPASQEAEGGEGLVTLQVQLRPEHVRLLRQFAAREGASVEALAALWLEEKLDEARSR
jgi:hypothetical protein